MEEIGDNSTKTNAGITESIHVKWIDEPQILTTKSKVLIGVTVFLGLVLLAGTILSWVLVWPSSKSSTTCSTKIETTAIITTTQPLINLMRIYSNATLKMIVKTYGGTSFVDITGIEEVISGGDSIYYVIDYSASSVLIFDQNFQFQRSIAFVKFSFALKYIFEALYVTSNDNVYKTDLNLNIQGSFNSVSAGFRSLSYESISSSLYIAGSNSIWVFDKKLNLTQTIFTGMVTYGLSSYNGLIYIGTCNWLSQLLVYQNNILTKMYDYSTVCANDCLPSILLDSYGYMVINCWNQQKSALFDINGNYLNTFITTLSTPYFSFVDSKGRYIIISRSQLEIY